MLFFPLVKFKIESIHKHVLILNENVFQIVKGSKEITVIHF
jgi:hypothetical protein